MCCIPAFHDIEDSLASFGPGTGDFPSISNFDHDHSLQLPQFPSDDETDTHATPSVPPNLATIQESEVCPFTTVFVGIALEGDVYAI